MQVPSERRPTQRGYLPSAELSTVRRWPAPLSEAAMAMEAAALAKKARSAYSPFVRDLDDLQREWYESAGGGDASEPEKWQDAGRDAMEKAASLHRLSMLLARQERYGEALDTAGRAAEFLPDSAILRRVLIALSEGDGMIVEEARKAFPDDPEIWLASLVVRLRGDVAGSVLSEIAREVSAAATHQTFSPGAMVRAGDFLLRRGVVGPACEAARDAIERGRGLLAAYVLGLNCAFAVGDVDWALHCALNGADHAAQPGPFYRTVVELKSVGRNVDRDLIGALQYLRERFPRNTEWTERLGQAYFLEGDARRALSVLSPLVNQQDTRLHLQHLLLAAESARLSGDRARCVRVLERAYAAYPENFAVLNNLVYALSQEQETLARAQALLPELTARAGESFAALDTIAVVYLKSGRFDEAESFMSRALAELEPAGYSALEVKLNSAEILVGMGEYEEAKRKLDEIRRDPGRSEFLDLRARRLLNRVEEALARER